MIYLLYFLFSLVVLSAYFKLAVRYDIVDKPNNRSSHNLPTIRGGGIIFPVVLLLYALLNGLHFQFFLIGLLLISAISFYDDLKPLSNVVRIISQLISVSLLFMQTDLMIHPFWIIIIAYVLVIGTINAYNFMDGINGITGSYSLLTILTLYFLYAKVGFIILPEYLLVTISALVAFNIFNFRDKAKCFAGDVGSVSMAFIIIFFLLLLILKTGQLKFLGFLLIYGLDTVITIVLRLFRKENIFEAHRSHFYQYLVNNLYLSHLKVSVLYLVSQLFINVVIIAFDLDLNWFLLLILISGFLFLGLRFMIEGKETLIGIKEDKKSEKKIAIK